MDVPTSMLLASLTFVVAIPVVLLLWNLVVPDRWKVGRPSPFVDPDPDDPAVRRALYWWAAYCLFGIVVLLLLAKLYRHLFPALTVPAASFAS